MHDDPCHSLISAAHGWNGERVSDELKDATRKFDARVPTEPALLSRVTASLDVIDPGAAAWIAVTCGACIEDGADAGLSIDGIVRLLEAWLPKLPDVDSDTLDGPEPTVEQAALLKLFSYLCQALVSHLARLPARRAEMAANTSLVERLGELTGYSFGAHWLQEALFKSSGTLVLLHPASGKGLRIRYTNISNCFHLFSLLQVAVGTRLDGGRVPDEAVAQVARGARNEPVTDEAWWHYGNPLSRKPDPLTSIWGEGLVREIPAVDGTQVMLAWSPVLKARSWDASFLTPHLAAMPADVSVDGELTGEESAAWLRRLGVSAPAKWWQFWRGRA